MDSWDPKFQDENDFINQKPSAALTVFFYNLLDKFSLCDQNKQHEHMECREEGKGSILFFNRSAEEY